MPSLRSRALHRALAIAVLFAGSVAVASDSNLPSEEARNADACSRRVARPRDWVTDATRLRAPVSHRVAASSGGALDQEAFGGANVVRA